MSVTVPRKGDTLYLATDACTSLPAGGTKMFLARPGVQGFLPSFNFGCRLPDTLKQWSPCEVEAYFLHKGIEKAQFYSRLTENPSIALTDSKPVFQAKQKLCIGDTVFVKSDLSKSKARESYVVLNLDVINQQATIQKFPMSKFRSHPIVVEFQNLYKPPAARSYPSPITEEL